MLLSETTHLKALSAFCLLKFHWSALHLEGVFFYPGTTVCHHAFVPWKYWLMELWGWPNIRDEKDTSFLGITVRVPWLALPWKRTQLCSSLPLNFTHISPRPTLSWSGRSWKWSASLGTPPWEFPPAPFLCPSVLPALWLHFLSSLLLWPSVFSS